MLWARAAEMSAIDRLLTLARSGHGGGLLLVGEPGIGKSALLGYAREQAADALVLSAAGAPAEANLAYALAHQLIRPLLRPATTLPAPQAAALRVAFGLDPGPAPEPFLVALAVLTLLSDAGGPVLCLVDDVQWADLPSLQVLAFVVRRLPEEPLAVLVTDRLNQDFLTTNRGNTLVSAGLPTWRVSPVADPDAAALLDRQWAPARLVRDALVLAAAGNPLALAELPATLSAAQLAGTEPLPEPLPLAGELRHPLIRSAVYYGAEPAGRRAAHAALAAALAPPGDPAAADSVALADVLADGDRRAWHLARAASGPDEEAADALERSADRTLQRSGYGAAAAALERAAELSVSAADRSRRLAAAAEAAWHGSDVSRVRDLLGRAADLAGAAGSSAGLRIRYLRGLIELRAGAPGDGLAVLLPACAEAVTADPHLAVAMLTAAGECAFQAGDEGAAKDISAMLATLSGLTDPDDAQYVALATSVRPLSAGERPGPLPVVLDDLERLDDPDLLARAGGMLYGLGRYAIARRLRLKAVERARAPGAAGTLAWALRSLTMDELDRGRYAWAGAYATEGRELAVEAGHPNLACQHQAFLAATGETVRRRDRTANVDLLVPPAHANTRFSTPARSISVS